jgi:hypothetical protein
VRVNAPERLVAREQATNRFHMERTNLKKVNKVEIKKISDLNLK